MLSLIQSHCILPAIERLLSKVLFLPSMINPVSLVFPSSGHLLIVLAEGLIFLNCETTSSDVSQGYEVGTGVSLLVVIFHIRERRWSQKDHLECSGYCRPFGSK